MTLLDGCFRGTVNNWKFFPLNAFEYFLLVSWSFKFLYLFDRTIYDDLEWYHVQYKTKMKLGFPCSNVSLFLVALIWIYLMRHKRHAVKQSVIGSQIPTNFGNWGKKLAGGLFKSKYIFIDSCFFVLQIRDISWLFFISWLLAYVYIDLTVTFAITLAAFLDPENIVRFVELLLKKKVVLLKC